MAPFQRPDPHLMSVVWYSLPFLDGTDLLKAQTVCREIKEMLEPHCSSGIWQLQENPHKRILSFPLCNAFIDAACVGRPQYRRWLSKSNIRLIEGAAHHPHPSAALPESRYREARRRGKVISDLGANKNISELRWGKATCENPTDEMGRSRSAAFVLSEHLYEFGGVVGGIGQHNSYKNDLWRVSLQPLLSFGKYAWEECVVAGSPPASSDSLTLTPISVPSPTPTHIAHPEMPQRYFACGGQPVCYFTSTFVPVRSSAHADGFVFIFGGKDTDGEALSSTTIVDVATWSFNDNDRSVSGTPPAARLNHTATLIKDRYVFIVGGEEWGESEYHQPNSPVGFSCPPDVAIFDGDTKTWIDFDDLPWVSSGIQPSVDDARLLPRMWLAHVIYMPDDMRFDFARHSAVAAGDKIVIMVPYVCYDDEMDGYGNLETIVFDISTGQFALPGFSARPQKTSITPP
ncbi:unnamed protein product [Vitrella brassicaformis CCMP3155]|uniref:Uncharacterized protein n=1 Tax=Vitrella brassicaformis (strain CCMP3155) TaxID=1169540 RepID=A0A0G4H724_VITBC|nr:unnamed protein product [Vitrella brassicaformis CCMP3155]|eukprot:CEM39503.1 unnamed protein product [Vitrella brassicaformis CCMP3155]